MPVRFSINPDCKLVTVVCEGLVTDAELFEFRGLALADPALAETHLVLYDARRVTGVSLSALSLWKLAYEAMRQRTTRRSIVAPEQSSLQVDSALQIMRMVQGNRLCVTRDMREARAWLGLPPDDCEQDSRTPPSVARRA
jgi:hypothetical protein